MFRRKRLSVSTKTASIPEGANEPPSRVSEAQAVAAPFGALYGNVTRFLPVHDDISRPTVADQWIPTDPRALNRFWRYIYVRDAIGGPAVDFYKEIPWCDFSLVGVNDDFILKRYNEFMDQVNILDIMSWVTAEFLIIGRNTIHGQWDESRGYWKNIIVHDPDFVNITPVPVTGCEPKIDLKVTSEMRKFLWSKDPRDIEAMKSIPEDMKRMILRNSSIPLNPKTTLCVIRKSFPADFAGTSIYSRIVNYVALEKALINVNVSVARRRAGQRLHAVVGEANRWEPDPMQLDEVIASIMSLEEDPVGGIMATGPGVTVSPIGGTSSDFWKWSEESQHINEGKMRSLGLNDAIMSGDANWSVTAAALSSFMHRIKAMRDFLTRKVIYNMLFRVIAERNNFRKTTKARVNNRIIVKSAGTEDLIMPTIEWVNKLETKTDDARIDLLAKINGMGIPISLRDVASAADYDLDSAMHNMDQDVSLRKRIDKTYTKQMPSAAQGSSGSGYEARRDQTEQEAELNKGMRKFAGSSKELMQKYLRNKAGTAKYQFTQDEGFRLINAISSMSIKRSVKVAEIDRIMDRVVKGTSTVAAKEQMKAALKNDLTRMIQMNRNQGQGSEQSSQGKMTKKDRDMLIGVQE